MFDWLARRRVAREVNRQLAGTAALLDATLMKDRELRKAAKQRLREALERADQQNPSQLDRWDRQAFSSEKPEPPTERGEA